MSDKIIESLLELNYFVWLATCAFFNMFEHVAMNRSPMRTELTLEFRRHLALVLQVAVQARLIHVHTIATLGWALERLFLFRRGL